MSGIIILLLAGLALACIWTIAMLAALVQRLNAPHQPAPVVAVKRVKRVEERPVPAYARTGNW